MNGQRIKLLRKRFIELYGSVEDENVKLFRKFKKVFNKKTKVVTITKELFEEILES